MKRAASVSSTKLSAVAGTAMLSSAVESSPSSEKKAAA